MKKYIVYDNHNYLVTELSLIDDFNGDDLLQVMSPYIRDESTIELLELNKDDFIIIRKDSELILFYIKKMN